MIDINNLNKETLMKLVEQVEKDENYIINNYSINDRISLFNSLLSGSELISEIEDKYQDMFLRFMLSILTHDELTDLEKSDQYKEREDELEFFKVLTSSSQSIASYILSEESDGIYMALVLKEQKRKEILEIIRDNIFNILEDKSKKEILDKIIDIEEDKEFITIIKQLGSKNIISILENYPKLVKLYQILNEIEDDNYKESCLKENREYDNFRIIDSIKDKQRKYDLAEKYLSDLNIKDLIVKEDSESFRFELFCRFSDKLGYYLDYVINSFESSEKIYDAIMFLINNNITIVNMHLKNAYDKLDQEYIIKIIDLLFNKIPSYDLLYLVKKLDNNKKYEYILKYKNKFDEIDMLKILVEDFEVKKINEDEFVNLIIEIIKDIKYYMKHELFNIIALVSDSNKLKLIDSARNYFDKTDIRNFIDKMNLSETERLDLIIKYDICGGKENELVAKLHIDLRLEYIRKLVLSNNYKVSDEDLLNILEGMNFKAKFEVLDILKRYSKINFEIISKIDLNIDSLSDEEILELLETVVTTDIKFFIAVQLKDNLIKCDIYKKLYIVEHSNLINIAIDSFDDESVKFNFITIVANYSGNLEYTIDLLNKVNLDSNFFEKFIMNNTDPYYNIIFKAIMISKFDDRLKIKYFNKIDISMDDNYFKMLLESLKFDDLSLNYETFRSIIKDLFYKKQFNLFENININILSYYFNDTEAYFLNERNKLNNIDKKLLDDKIDFNSLTKEKINHILHVINGINNSNCLEIIRLGKELKPLLILEENPIEKLKSLEKIFLRNNLPLGVKFYEVFEVLHPDFKNFSGDIYSVVLNNNEIPMSFKYKILLEDMVKISFSSAPKHALDYINEMKSQIDLLRKLLYLKNKNIKYEDLDEQTKVIINNILNIVNSWSFIFKFDNEKDLSVVYEYLNEDMIEGIENWIVNIISNSIGIDFKHLTDIEKYIINNLERINKKNKEYSDFTLKKGDLIKGITNYEKYLFTMLQNGINCQEFLGANAGGDLTNLDTDFSMIRQEDENIEYTMSRTSAACYGNVWIVLKNKEGRFNTDGSIHDKRMELFKINGEFNDNYGIRSGVPTTEIDYMICEKWNERIGFAIACSNIYIPVINKAGELLFSYDDFEKMRSKMQGLSYYDCDSYKVSSTMYKGSPDTISYLIKDADEINRKREIIYNEIDSIINSLGYNVLHNLDDDFTTDNMELIDTGSTSRGNNKPNDADFDFMLRMDSDIYKDESSKFKFVNCIENRLKELGGTPNVGNNPPERLRYKDVYFEGIEESTEIDISFIQRTNKVDYTTDMCLIDRMNNIRNQHPDLYNSVRLNVIIAKSLLKRAGIYKRIDKGLGGVGTENWILQNGGSVIDAVSTFLDVADNCKTFNEFKSKYSIFDFGSNFYDSSITDGHDDFIYNLSDDNYNKMKEELIKFKTEYEEAINNGTIDEYITNLIGFEEVFLNNKKIN